jgi:hypothetical protein
MESTDSGHGSVAGCHGPPLTVRFLLQLITMVFCKDCQSVSSSLCNFLHPPSQVQIFTASPNSSSLKVMDQVSHPHKTQFVTVAVATLRTASLVSSPKCPLWPLGPLSLLFRGCHTPQSRAVVRWSYTSIMTWTGTTFLYSRIAHYFCMDKAA